jgi:60 kDa SS-A/Ro ribonucleoprotein
MANTTDPLARITTRRTSQSEPILGRTDQVANSAGGQVFAVDKWMRLHRFLILGTEGGTYYIGEQQLTRENAQAVIDCLAEDGRRVVAHIVKVSLDGAAPKQDQTLFALALAAGIGDDATRKYAFEVVPVVVRTGTMLFQFNTYLSQFRGWGRGRQTAISAWYSREADRVAYQAVKYRKRGGWTHRDLLRLAKTKPDSAQHQALFRWIVGKPLGEFAYAVPPIIEGFEAVQRATSVDIVASLVRSYKLPWEALPDQWMNEPAVWEALLENIGLTALLRQLPRLTRIGLISPMQPLPAALTRLTDLEQLTKARIHPIAVLNALFGYKEGHPWQVRDGIITPIYDEKRIWTPVTKVIDLLDAAFYASFGAVTPSGKRTLLALDVSGSMGSRLPGIPALTARDGSAAMAMTALRTEEHTVTLGFTAAGSSGYRSGRRRMGWQPDAVTVLPLSARQRLDDAIRTVSGLPFGGTDCSLPMLWATAAKVNVDLFVIYTDSETWAGGIHPTQALEQYRQKSGIDARLAVVGMTSNGFSIADPRDAGQLDVVGFDTATPQILTEFALGQV